MAAMNINAQETMKENVDFNVWPKGELNSAYAKYFIGNSYLAPLGGENGLVNVTFEPRCRNNWHIHHKSVQVLICVAGHGWYVEEGKEPVAMHPGTVVAIPAEAKHWHGAAKDSWFQHLTYMTKVEQGASNAAIALATDNHDGEPPRGGHRGTGGMLRRVDAQLLAVGTRGLPPHQPLAG